MTENLIQNITIILHVVFSGIWLSAFIVNLLLSKKVEEEKEFTSFWLKYSNLNGIIGLVGILLTGFTLTMLGGYGFFKFASGHNHWLYTKQFVTVIIMIITGALLIPTAKKLRLQLSSNENDDLRLQLIKKVKLINNIITGLVLLNIVMAFLRYISH